MAEPDREPRLFDDDAPGFPACATCRYRLTGPPRQCVICAARTITSPAAERCPICSQALQAGQRCTNWLCRNDRERAFSRVDAIAMKTGALEQTLKRYKYGGRVGWALIWSRLLLGWLEQHAKPGDIDLIVAAPTYTGRPRRRFPHTEAVIREAAAQDTLGMWPFDLGDPPALTAVGPSPQSVGRSLAGKRAAAAALSEVLVVPRPERVAGRRLLVYDDVLTTGFAMSSIARALLDAGAVEIRGIVLARQPWSAG